MKQECEENALNQECQKVSQPLLGSSMYIKHIDIYKQSAIKNITLIFVLEGK